MFSELRKWSDYPIVIHLFRDRVLFQGIYYTFGLYFTTFGSLVSHFFRRHLYNNGFMISFCWLVGELTLKNSAFDKIAKIRDGPKNCDGPQKAWFLHVLLCRQLSTSAFEFSWFVDNENTCRYQPYCTCFLISRQRDVGMHCHILRTVRSYYDHCQNIGCRKKRWIWSQMGQL